MNDALQMGLVEAPAISALKRCRLEPDGESQTARTRHREK